MGNEPVKQEIPIKDQIREQKRNIDRSARNMEREMKKYEREEKKIFTEMKKMGKNGQDVAAKTLAKEVVRLRKTTTQMNGFIGQLKAASLRISSVNTLNDMAEAMSGVNKAMNLASKNLDPKKLASLSKEMAMSEGKLEMNQEMISSVLDDMADNMGDPIEEEKIYQDVLKEAGLDLGLSNIKPSNNKNVEVNKDVDNIDELLNSLQKK